MAKKAAILAGVVSLAAIAPTRINGTVERVDGGVRVTAKRPYSGKLETKLFPNSAVIGGMEASADEGGFVDVLISTEIFNSSVEDVNAVELDEEGFLTFNDEDSDAIFINASLATGAPTFTSNAFDAEGTEKKAPAKKPAAKKTAKAEDEDDGEEETPKKATGKKAGKKPAAKKPAKEEEEEWD
jgi:hypothetical protein